MPKVSIVLPTYNGEKYINESIESILSQTFSDWELIIVNDCSTDRTPQIVQKYADKDARIRIIHNQVNQKLPNSLNIGFEQAKGEYLTWTSDDNYYLPSALEEMVNFLNQNPEYPMVCAGMNSIDEKGDIIGKFPLYDNQLIFYQACVGACFMYKRQVITDLGIYSTQWFLVEDYEYWLRIRLHYGLIGRINHILYNYRYHENSLTGSRLKEIKKQLYKLRKKYFSKLINNLTNESLKRQLVLEMVPYCMSNSEDRKILENVFPTISLLRKINSDIPIYVYGAGEFGNRAYNYLKNNITNYIDRDESKIGKYLNEIKIISFQDYLNIEEPKQLVIALSEEKISDVLINLQNEGIDSCSIIQSIEIV